MEWAVKKYLLGGLLFVAVLASTTVILLQQADVSASLFTAETTMTNCFDRELNVVSTSSQDSCSATSINLGRGKLTAIVDSASVTDEVHPLLMNRFEAARISANLDGVHLYITSGFRSKSRQAELFAREVVIRGSETEAAKWVLPPNYSHHPLGLALDINYPGDRAGAGWLESNGWRFGLCRVYQNEWWHFEGAGEPGRACPPMAPNALVDLP